MGLLRSLKSFSLQLKLILLTTYVTANAYASVHFCSALFSKQLSPAAEELLFRLQTAGINQPVYTEAAKTIQTSLQANFFLKVLTLPKAIIFPDYYWKAISEIEPGLKANILTHLLEVPFVLPKTDFEVFLSVKNKDEKIKFLIQLSELEKDFVRENYQKNKSDYQTEVKKQTDEASFQAAISSLNPNNRLSIFLQRLHRRYFEDIPLRQLADYVTKEPDLVWYDDDVRVHLNMVRETKTFKIFIPSINIDPKNLNYGSSGNNLSTSAGRIIYAIMLASGSILKNNPNIIS